MSLSTKQGACKRAPCAGQKCSVKNYTKVLLISANYTATEVYSIITSCTSLQNVKAAWQRQVAVLFFSGKPSESLRSCNAESIIFHCTHFIWKWNLVCTLRYEVPPQQRVEHRFNSIHLLDDKCFSKSDCQLQGCHEVIILWEAQAQTRSCKKNLKSSAFATAG